MKNVFSLLFFSLFFFSQVSIAQTDLKLHAVNVSNDTWIVKVNDEFFEIPPGTSTDYDLSPTCAYNALQPNFTATSVANPDCTFQLSEYGAIVDGYIFDVDCSPNTSKLSFKVYDVGRNGCIRRAGIWLED